MQEKVTVIISECYELQVIIFLFLLVSISGFSTVILYFTCVRRMAILIQYEGNNTSMINTM
jgi:hypothetical protein